MSSPLVSPARRTCTSTRAAGRSRRSTSWSPTTGSPCATWSATTRSTTRPTARTTATARTTTARGTAASRDRPTTPRSTGCGCASSATSSPPLLLSQGVPMIAHGDELGRTQQRQQQRLLPGQRDHVGRLGFRPQEKDLLAFTSRVVALRQNHPVFRRRRFFAGRASHGGESDVGDIGWFMPGGEHMDEEAWVSGHAKTLMVFLNGRAIREMDERRRPRGRRLVPHPVQRPRRADHVHAAPTRSTGRRGSSRSTLRPTSRRPCRRPPERSLTRSRPQAAPRSHRR